MAGRAEVRRQGSLRKAEDRRRQCLASPYLKGRQHSASAQAQARASAQQSSKFSRLLSGSGSPRAQLPAAACVCVRGKSEAPVAQNLLYKNGKNKGMWEE